MKIISLIVVTVLALGSFSCRDKRPVDRMTDTELKTYATQLAVADLLADGHVDLPYRLMKKKYRPEELKAILQETSDGEFDVKRAKEGGLDALFMSIYVPSSYQMQADHGKAYADSLIDLVRAMPVLLPDQLALANSPAEVKANGQAGKISLPMGMENGAPIGDSLKNIQYFFGRGIRYFTLTHGKFNQICGSSGDTIDTHQGLTAYGREVVKEMNRVGIMVDISHVDDSTFYQVMKLTKVPCIASHSSCRHLAPPVKRDMTDEMILKLGENGGVILINFCSGFLDSLAYQNYLKMDAQLTEKKLKPWDPEAQAFLAQLIKDNPVSIEAAADHIDHVVKLAGIDHVGFGSDFDGVGGYLPAELKDVSMYPNLIHSLLKRGYSEADIEKIGGGNFMRVWQQVLDARN